MIQAVTVYRTRGKQFERFAEALEYREGLVEKFFREDCPGFYDIPLSQRTAFVEAVLAKRAVLIDLLRYDDKPEETD